MIESKTLEIIIANDDHRVLSANAEAWSLVHNDVFVPMENFLCVEDREEFLRHITQQDQHWFTVSFVKEPEEIYLIQLADMHASRFSDVRDHLRLLLIRTGDIMTAYQESVMSLESYDAMLALYEDLFFEYRPEEGIVTLLNTDRSRYDEAIYPLERVEAMLHSITDEDNIPALETFLGHMRKGTRRFAISIPQNLFNFDRNITATMIKGSVVYHEGQPESIIGVMHPQRLRGTGSTEFTYDQLTGLVNKSDITQVAVERIENQHAQTTLCIIDVDYFKHVNDTYGHQYGDEVLKHIASVIEAEVANRGLAGRIGGDEFFLVLYDTDETIIRAHLRSIKSLINDAFRGKGPQEDKPISVSIGTASYPNDAANYDDLFLLADFCLYLAKEKGRNRYIIYTPDKHPSFEEICAKQNKGGRGIVNGRDDLPLGDALTQMQFLVRYGKRPELDKLLPEYAGRFGIPLLFLYCERSQAVIAAGGIQRDEAQVVADAISDCLFDDSKLPVNAVKYGMNIVNNVDRLDETDAEVRDRLLAVDVRSYIVCRFTDAAGRSRALVFASLSRNVFWNEQHFMYYRLFTDSLALYDE